MTSGRTGDGASLAGRAVFLSASVPAADRAERYRRLPHAQVEIEQAVVSLARAVFAHDGRLVFGGHPSISPLVAMVAAEYFSGHPASRGEHERPEDRQPPAPVSIYQLEVFRTELPDATTDLVTLGHAGIVWQRMDPVDHDAPAKPAEPKYGRSLRAMRERMLRESELVAMVAIGGMEGVEEETEMFLDRLPGRPVYVIAATGGAARLIADRRSRIARERVRVVDEQLLDDLPRARLRGADGKSYEAPLRYVPYPLIAQHIVREIAAGPGEMPG